jgi:hypothetical protein
MLDWESIDLTKYRRSTLNCQQEEEGRRKKKEERRKKEEGRRKNNCQLSTVNYQPNKIAKLWLLT